MSGMLKTTLVEREASQAKIQQLLSVEDTAGGSPAGEAALVRISIGRRRELTTATSPGEKISQGPCWMPTVHISTRGTSALRSARNHNPDGHPQRKTAAKITLNFTHRKCCKCGMQPSKVVVCLLCLPLTPVVKWPKRKLVKADKTAEHSFSFLIWRVAFLLAAVPKPAHSGVSGGKVQDCPGKEDLGQQLAIRLAQPHHKASSDSATSREWWRRCSDDGNSAEEQFSLLWGWGTLRRYLSGTELTVTKWGSSAFSLIFYTVTWRTLGNCMSTPSLRARASQSLFIARSLSMKAIMRSSVCFGSEWLWKQQLKRHKGRWGICSDWSDYILTIKKQMIMLSPDKCCHSPELLISWIQTPLQRWSLPSQRRHFAPIKLLLLAGTAAFGRLQTGRYLPTL